MDCQDFDFTFEKKLSLSITNQSVVHLGSNDLSIFPWNQLFQSIKFSFLRYKLLVLTMSIVWSDILSRLYWPNAKSATRVDSMRKEVNRKV